jgi:hypothetical protein
VAPKGYKLSAESKAKITGRLISSNEPGPIHIWLTKHYQKMGVCENCERQGRTDWAYLDHPNPHTRIRGDYLELCRKCHRKMDDPVYGWSKQLPKAATREQRQAAGRLGAAVRWGTLFYLAAMCCARYRSKDETDLAWNRIRRQITRDTDTRIQNFREKLLDELLTAAWDRYTAAIETGDLVELEDEATRWVDELLRRQLRPTLEAMNGDVAKR